MAAQIASEQGWWNIDVLCKKGEKGELKHSQQSPHLKNGVIIGTYGGSELQAEQTPETKTVIGFTFIHITYQII